MKITNKHRFTELADLIGRTSLANLMGISRVYLYTMLLDENIHLIENNKDKINFAIDTLTGELNNLKIK